MSFKDLHYGCCMPARSPVFRPNSHGCQNRGNRVVAVPELAQLLDAPDDLNLTPMIDRFTRRTLLAIGKLAFVESMGLVLGSERDPKFSQIPCDGRSYGKNLGGDLRRGKLLFEIFLP